MVTAVNRQRPAEERVDKKARCHTAVCPVNRSGEFRDCLLNTKDLGKEPPTNTMGTRRTK